MNTFLPIITLIFLFIPFTNIAKNNDHQKKSLLKKISQQLNKKAKSRVKKINFPYMDSKQAQYYVGNWPEKPTPRPPDYCKINLIRN